MTTAVQRIDIELLNKIIVESGLNAPDRPNLNDFESVKEYIFSASKLIFKEFIPRSTLRKNRKGISISIQSDEIEAITTFLAGATEPRLYGDKAVEVQRLVQLGSVMTGFSYLSNYREHMKREGNKITFLVYFTHMRFYEANLVYNVIFEIINYYNTLCSHVAKFEEYELARHNYLSVLEAEERVRLEREAEERRLREDALSRGVSDADYELSRRLRESIARQSGQRTE